VSLRSNCLEKNTNGDNPIDPSSRHSGYVRKNGRSSIGVDTSGYNTITISFQSRGHSLEAGETACFEVSYNGGRNWTAVLSQENHNWKQHNIDLSAFSGGLSDNNPNFMIRFGLNANSTNDYFDLDNIVANACPITLPTMAPTLAGTPDIPPHLEADKSAEARQHCETSEITLTVSGAGDPVEDRKPVDVMLLIDRAGSMGSSGGLPEPYLLGRAQDGSIWSILINGAYQKGIVPFVRDT